MAGEAEDDFRFDDATDDEAELTPQDLHLDEVEALVAGEDYDEGLYEDSGAVAAPIARAGDATGEDALSAAIRARDASALVAAVSQTLHDVPNLRVGLPPSAPPCSDTSAECVAGIKESVAATLAKIGAASPASGRFCILIVTPSAPRAATLCGVLARGGIKVAKLFARHLDPAEQAATLSSKRVEVHSTA